jgi:hypothetical protein
MDAIMLFQDAMSRSVEAVHAVFTFADAHRVPVAVDPAAPMRSGRSVLSAATDIPDHAKMAASLSDKVHKGTRAGAMPVGSRESLLLNSVKAWEPGLTVPQGLLRQATEIIH